MFVIWNLPTIYSLVSETKKYNVKKNREKKMNILAKSDNRHKYRTASHQWCKAVDICSCSLICLNFPFYRCFLTENEWRYTGLHLLAWLVSKKFYQENKLFKKINIYMLLYHTYKEYLLNYYTKYLYRKFLCYSYELYQLYTV